MTAPGWYHAAGDPEGTQRYWDGNQWVGDPVAQASQPVAPAAPTAPPTPPPSPGGAPGPAGFAAPTGDVFTAGAPAVSTQLDRRWTMAAIGAAVLVAIGTFGSWVSLGPFSLSGLDTDDGKLVLAVAVIGGGAAVAALLQPGGQKAIRITYAVCGVLALLIVLANIGDVTDLGAGWGYWLDLVAGIAMSVLGIFGDRFLPKV